MKQSKVELKVRAHYAVKEISDERGDKDNGGLWVYLKTGYCDGSDQPSQHSSLTCLHAVHEPTWTKCWTKLQHVVPCVCAACTAGLVRAVSTDNTLHYVLVSDLPKDNDDCTPALCKQLPDQRGWRPLASGMSLCSECVGLRNQLYFTLRV